jgi:hypothetical protein
MSPGDREPPGRERPGPTAETGPIQKSADTTTDKAKITAQSRHFHAGGRRRREAALRLPPIGRCGCIRDPDLDKHRCGARPLSDHQVDGWRSAAIDIIEDGYVPIVPAEVVRRLWKRGGRDRRLAQQLHRLAGEVVA